MTSYTIEWVKNAAPYLSTFILSAWGGVVSYVQRMRANKAKFSSVDLFVDVLISSFAGLLTYFFCQYAKVDGALAAILIAVSGHMGTRAITSFERFRDRILGVSDK